MRDQPFSNERDTQRAWACPTCMLTWNKWLCQVLHLRISPLGRTRRQRAPIHRQIGSLRSAIRSAPHQTNICDRKRVQGQAGRPQIPSRRLELRAEARSHSRLHPRDLLRELVLHLLCGALRTVECQPHHVHITCADASQRAPEPLQVNWGSQTRTA
jgi:hypothetical protein